MHLGWIEIRTEVLPALILCEILKLNITIAPQQESLCQVFTVWKIVTMVSACMSATWKICPWSSKATNTFIRSRTSSSWRRKESWKDVNNSISHKLACIQTSKWSPYASWFIFFFVVGNANSCLTTCIFAWLRWKTRSSSRRQNNPVSGEPLLRWKLVHKPPANFKTPFSIFTVGIGPFFRLGKEVESLKSEPPKRALLINSILLEPLDV